MIRISFIVLYQIWWISYGWPGRAGAKADAVHNVSLEINKWQAFRLFFKPGVEHVVCFPKTHLVNSVWLGWLGWACSLYVIFTMFGGTKKRRECRLFKKKNNERTKTRSKKKQRNKEMPRF